MNKNTEGKPTIPPLKTLLLKITSLVLFMVLSCTLTTKAENSQIKSENVTLSIVSKPTQTVLTEIERQTGYLFMVNSNVDTQRIVSFKAENKPIK